MSMIVHGRRVMPKLWSSTTIDWLCAEQSLLSSSSPLPASVILCFRTISSTTISEMDLAILFLTQKTQCKKYKPRIGRKTAGPIACAGSLGILEIFEMIRWERPGTVALLGPMLIFSVGVPATKTLPHPFALEWLTFSSVHFKYEPGQKCIADLSSVVAVHHVWNDLVSIRQKIAKRQAAWTKISVQNIE